MLPGTYGTALLKNHLMSSYLTKIQENGAPPGVIEVIKEGSDLKLNLFGNEISINAMWAVIIITIIVLSIIFIAINSRKKRSNKK